MVRCVPLIPLSHTDHVTRTYLVPVLSHLFLFFSSESVEAMCLKDQKTRGRLCNWLIQKLILKFKICKYLLVEIVGLSRIGPLDKCESVLSKND